MKNLISFIVIMALALISCETEQINKIDSQQNPLPITEADVFVQSEYNLAMRDFALVVGKAMKENVEFRKMVKQESLKMERGGVGVHLKEFAEKNVETVVNKSTVHNLLDYYSETNNSSSNIVSKSTLNSFIEALLEQYPRLVISIPVNAENWDETGYMPLIAFAPEEANVQTLYLPGYDPNNNFNFIAIDAKTPPDEPLIVIVEDYSLTEQEKIEMENKGIIVISGGTVHPIELPEIPTLPTFDPGDGKPITAAPLKPKKPVASKRQDGIYVSWGVADNTTDSNRPISYRLYRRTGNGVYEEAGWTPAEVRSFLDKKTTVGETTTYYVIAWNPKGSSPPSDESEPIEGIGNPPKLATFNTKAVSSNSVKLNWTLNGDTQYVDEFLLMRKKSENADYQNYKTFVKNSTEYINREFIDNSGLNVFDTAFYKLHISVGNQISQAAEDFVFMPERNPAIATPVRLNAIRFKGSMVSFWEWNFPSINIKVVNVDRNDNNKTKIVVNEIYIDGPYKGIGGIFGNNYYVSYICNNHLFNWTIGDWYDSVTFYVQKTKGSGSNVFDIFGSLNIKGNAGQIVQIAGNLLRSSFSRAKDIEIGEEYTNYFSPVWSEIEFQNHETKILISNKPTGNILADWAPQYIRTYFIECAEVFGF